MRFKIQNNKAILPEAEGNQDSNNTDLGPSEKINEDVQHSEGHGPSHVTSQEETHSPENDYSKEEQQQTNQPQPLSSLDLNNELSPCFAMLFDLLFEGDLPKNKSSESNILTSSESLVIESLTQMRGGLLCEEKEQFVDDLLGGSQPLFDQTPEFGVYPSPDSNDTDEDNRPLRWIVQKKMVPISSKGNEKVTEETPKRRSFTRSNSKKLMGDAMKSSITTTAERCKKRKWGNVLVEIPDTDVVDVSIEDSEHDGVEKGPEEKGGNKRKRETSHVIKPASGTGPGPLGNEDDHEESQQSIVNNLRLQKVLRGRVFDPDIITKHGMNSLYDLVEIQSWTHLFQTKSHILHEEEVREFYYNIEFEEDGSINTRVGDKNLHLTEDLLGQILEIPREGTRSVIGKTCTEEFVKECSKIPNTRRAGIQKKLMKGEYQLLFEFVNKDQLKHELEKMTVRVSSRDAKIAILTAALLKAQTKRPGTTEVRVLRKQNKVLLAKIVAFQEKAIKDNDEANTRLTLIIESLSHQPPSS
ncbi:hypothetical protein H5410_026555 [Solanum commersonii]|uniref:Uncharacterized protein n=1 Tax=Solanum commersonii TaxID=4109 RepID=A0A9J5YZC5_SOLCO|nr:hypothetical protein H5410_026555 [Solanum commersonii]